MTVPSDKLPDQVQDAAGNLYKVLKPAVPDADGWVRLQPEEKKQ